MKQLNWYQIFGKSNIPDGTTVLPTDDIQILLHCADIWNKSYTTLNELLADTDTLLAVINSENAVNYLVRSTTWASGVCADSTAMSYIGQNNYAANTLLDDATWCNAICNSEYFESVLNVKVPAMTSATAPEGEVSARGSYGSQVPYMAFDNNTNTAWRSQSLSTSDHTTWIQYRFPSKKKIYKAYWHATHSTTEGNLPNANIKIQASNNNSTFVDIYSESLGSIANKEFYFTFSCDTEYEYWRLWIDANVRNLQPSVYAMEAQFYGREDV